MNCRKCSTKQGFQILKKILSVLTLFCFARAKNDFQNRKLEAEHSESMRKLKEMHDLTMGKEKDVFEKQRMVFDKRIRELMSGIESKESDHVKVRWPFYIIVYLN